MASVAFNPTVGDPRCSRSRGTLAVTGSGAAPKQPRPIPIRKDARTSSLGVFRLSIWAQARRDEPFTRTRSIAAWTFIASRESQLGSASARYAGRLLITRHHACGSPISRRRTVIEEVWMSLCFLLAIEIAIGDRKHQALQTRLARAWLGVAYFLLFTGETRFGRALRGTAVAVDLVAIVALLFGIFIPIPTDLCAGTRDPLLSAGGFRGASLGAAGFLWIAKEEAVELAGIATLAGFDLFIAADALHAFRRTTCACGARLLYTSARTTVATLLVPVVTGFASCQCAVSAARDARFPCHATLPSVF